MLNGTRTVLFFPYGSMTPFYCVAFSTKVARKCDYQKHLLLESFLSYFPKLFLYLTRWCCIYKEVYPYLKAKGKRAGTYKPLMPLEEPC